MDRATVKLEAKGKISSVRGSFVCIALIIFATSLIISLAASGIGNNEGASLLTSAFSLLVTPMMTIALVFFFIMGWRMQSPRMGDWMNAIFDRFGRKLGGYLWMSLKIFLWMLPFLAAMMVYIYAVDLSGAFSTTPIPGSYQFRYAYEVGLSQYSTMVYISSGDAAKLIVPGLLYLAMLVTMIRLAYSYYFTTYILASCPNVRARDAVKLSVKMTKGYRWKIFVAELSFLGWGILSVLTVGILYLCYVGPYMGLTFAGMFETIKGEGIESGHLTYADFGEEAPDRQNLEEGNQA